MGKSRLFLFFRRERCFFFEKKQQHSFACLRCALGQLIALAMLLSPARADELLLGVAQKAGVRVLFDHTQTGWRPVCTAGGTDAACAFDASQRTAWFQFDGGRHTPPFMTQGWTETTSYMSQGVLKIAAGPIPQLAPAQEKWGNWMERSASPPLVVATRPTVDSFVWHNRPPASGDLSVFWPAFARAVPAIDHCQHGGQTRTPGVADVKVKTILQDNDGATLAHLVVTDAALKGCDGPLTLPSDLWLYRGAAGMITPLPAQLGGPVPVSLQPVAFADFTGNNQPEALFSLSMYDGDGFVLFENDFTKATVARWIYH